MRSIQVEEPESGSIIELQIKPVANFAFPGWVVLIPDQKNIFLFLQEGKWHVIPDRISNSYAQRIGEKLTELYV